MSNIEGLYSIYFYKKMERSDSTLRNSIFVIRYSAVRCSARMPAAKAANLIIKKPCHFGVVSYEYCITSPHSCLVAFEAWQAATAFVQILGRGSTQCLVVYLCQSCFLPDGLHRSGKFS